MSSRPRRGQPPASRDAAPQPQPQPQPTNVDAHAAIAPQNEDLLQRLQNLTLAHEQLQNQVLQLVQERDAHIAAQAQPVANGAILAPAAAAAPVAVAGPAVEAANAERR